jgi:FlaA1/EpsC-like NDP-sugar epimerase
VWLALIIQDDLRTISFGKVGDPMFSDFMMRYKSWFIAGFQIVLVLLGLTLAWLLRFDFTLPHREVLFVAVPILVVIRLAMLRIFNLHRGWWHFSGIREALDIFKAVTLGTAVFWLIMSANRGLNFPHAIYLLEAVLTGGLLASGRLASRVIAETMRRGVKATRKVILIGAGFAAEMVIREIQRDGSGYEVLGCVDDDPTKRGIRIHGAPVLGCVEELPQLLSRYAADEVLIAIPSATGEQMQRFITVCQLAKIQFRTVPALRDILNGQLTIQHLREVRIEDLLGRDPVKIDLREVRRGLVGKVVLVTGAAGSIGSELCRQIRSYGPRQLICLDQNESGIFYLQMELTETKDDGSIQFRVADIRDSERMRIIFRECRPDIIFHAAAYKHVPIMEKNVAEALNNNVFALLSLLDISGENACQAFVLISSDKAVNPKNVMGATKRLGEMILACRDTNSMRCVSVRFGNVLGSSGSVIPVLQRQLLNGQPLTITHPEVSRFFMTTREAVSLILQAFTLGDHGDILVLDMGEPVSILQLAKTLIRLSGKSEDHVSIRFTGLRDGEKLHEELFFATEEVYSTSQQKISRVRSKPMEWPILERQLKALQSSLSIDGASPILDKLSEIVPEYARLHEKTTPETNAIPLRRSSAGA